MAKLSEWPGDIHVVGVGGIGTHVLQILLESGARAVHLWDDDYVEDHNLPTQFIYCPDDISTSKVFAAATFVKARGFKTTIVPHDQRVTETTPLSGIVIIGVDTMASRAAIWETARYDPLIHFFVDGRIGGDTIQVHALDPCNPSHVTRYSSWIFEDELTTDMGCITRENPHSALGVAQVVSAHLALFLEGRPVVGYLERNLLRESENGQQPLVVRN